MLAIHRVAGKEIAQQELPFEKQNHAICCPRMIGQPTFVTVGDYGLPPSVWPEIPLEVLILHFPFSLLSVRKRKTEGAFTSFLNITSSCSHKESRIGGRGGPRKAGPLSTERLKGQ